MKEEIVTTVLIISRRIIAGTRSITVWNGVCNRTKVAIILDHTKFDPRNIKNGVTISTLSLALILHYVKMKYLWILETLIY